MKLLLGCLLVAGVSFGAYPLTGRWTAGRISTIQYRNATTGAPLPTSGNHFAYEFRGDGTYSFTGLMQSTMYNCTTSVFSQESGTYTVERDRVDLHPVKNPYKMTNTCAPSSNKEAPGKLIDRSYRFQIAPDGNFTKLELKSESDGAVSAFRRE